MSTIQPPLGDVKTEPTVQVRIYIAGPIEVAKQIIREECFRDGLCVTIEPTTYIYTGGEELGYVVGLVNYPRFPSDAAAIMERARSLIKILLYGTFQKTALLVGPETTEWYAIQMDGKA